MKTTIWKWVTGPQVAVVWTTSMKHSAEKNRKSLKLDRKEADCDGILLVRSTRMTSAGNTCQKTLSPKQLQRVEANVQKCCTAYSWPTAPFLHPGSELAHLHGCYAPQSQPLHIDH